MRNFQSGMANRQFPCQSDLLSCRTVLDMAAQSRMNSTGMRTTRLVPRVSWSSAPATPRNCSMGKATRTQARRVSSNLVPGTTRSCWMGKRTRIPGRRSSWHWELRSTTRRSSCCTMTSMPYLQLSCRYREYTCRPRCCRRAQIPMRCRPHQSI